jgi:hypothetical protein
MAMYCRESHHVGGRKGYLVYFRIYDVKKGFESFRDVFSLN